MCRDLSQNQLSGKLPQSFANLTSLKSLQENKFNGSINAVRDLPLDDLNVENNKFTGFIPNELKDIDNLLTGGNDWSDGTAPPPPPGEHHGAKHSKSNDNGGNKIVKTGVIIAGGCLAGLILFAGLIALLARKSANPSSHFIDEEKGGSHHSRPPFTRESSLKLSVEPPVYKGQKTLDSDNLIDAKAATMQRTCSTTLQNIQPPAPLKTNFDEPKPAVVPWANPTSLARPMERFVLADLEDATAGFAQSRLLGEGSIGRVYKAKYHDGRVLAVKEIESSLFEGGNAEDFSTIASNISKIQHSNIIRLVGYCSDQGSHMLVYEYFRSGSLHKFLHLSDDFSKPLTWNTRMRIALNTARAIEYLHETCSPSLVHKNIKSSNILLNAELSPHLSDYGLAIFHQRTSQNLGAGYNAPECTEPSAYTLKSDIYSFGVVMLELLTGRMPYDGNRAKPEQALVRWAAPQLKDMDALANMVDPALCGLYLPESVSRFAEIVSICVQAEPESRPSASEVVVALVRLVRFSNMDDIDLYSSR